MSSTELLDFQGIDALLDRFRAKKRREESVRATISEFEVDTPSVLRPEAVSWVELRFKSIATHLAREISANLRAQVSVELTAIRQIRMRSIADQQPERFFAQKIDFAEMSLPAFLFFDLPTATSIIDRLVGGNGAAVELDRPLTAIELRVLSDVVRPILESQIAGFPPIARFNVKNAGYIGQRNELRGFPATEIHIAARFNAKVEGGDDWNFQWCLPLAPLVDAIEKSAVVPAQTAAVAAEKKKRFQQILAAVKVGIEIEIGRATLSLADITSLQPGDVIMLEKKKGSTFDLAIEGRNKYRGHLGRTGASLAFKVTQTTEVAPPATPAATKK